MEEIMKRLEDINLCMYFIMCSEYVVLHRWA